MNLGRLSDADMLAVKKNILRGYGEIITYDWVDIETQEAEVDERLEGAILEVVDDTNSPTTKKKSYKIPKQVVEVPVKRTNEYYVGKMTLYQTSGVISVLGAIFVNGANFKESSGRTDNIAFLEFLDEYHLGVLASLVLGESRDWLAENWDVLQIIRVMKAFFKYNDFFGLLREVGAMGQDMGLTEDQARKVALGQASLLAG